MKRRIFSVLLACVCLLASLPSVSRAAERDMTIFLYLCGSDLESNAGEASGDLKEIMASGVGAQQNIDLIVCTGGARAWQRYGISNDTVQYYRAGVTKPELLYDAGHASMGESGTLSAFLRYGLAHYPASRYALILWDHGGGPVYGMCYDENDSDNALTMKELRRGLSDGLDGQRLSVLAFDACLMNCLETAAISADFADYMVASQEMVSGNGLNYDAFLRKLVMNPAIGAADLAVAMAQSYLSDNQGDTVTMSVVDCARVPDLMVAADEFGYGLMSLMERDMEAVVRLRGEVKSFGEFIDESASDLIDIATLCDTFAPLLPLECALLRQAASEAVIYAGATDDMADHAHGLSALVPYATARHEAREILWAYNGLDGGYAASVRAMTNAMRESDGYHVPGQSPDEGGDDTSWTTNIWEGFEGSSLPADIWAGYAASSMPQDIWEGYAASSMPEDIWEGFAEAEAPASLW